MKDHEKRELVSRITAVALEYRDAEQLRERIRDAVLPAIDAAEAAERERCAKLRTAAAQVLTDMRAQGVLLEWQTLMEEALRA